MKRIIIICEGPTEKEFCEKLLYSHFFNMSILIQWVYPKWSQGGHISWSYLLNQIVVTLKQDTTAFVTTFIDLYGLHKPELFPNWNEALILKRNPYQRVIKLEQGMSDALPENLRHRFIPNIILHEFEGLLFNDLSHFENQFNENEFRNKTALINVLNDFNNPELINETKENSPSHRLENVIFNNFKKTIHGIQIAESIGLIRLRQKSIHFNDWIKRLESI